MREVMGVIAWVVAGLIAGWLAGVTMKGGGYGRTGDLAVGLVGAFAGAWLFAFAAPADLANALAWSIVVAAIGAVAFIALARLLTQGSVRVSRSRAPEHPPREPESQGGDAPEA